MNRDWKGEKEAGGGSSRQKKARVSGRAWLVRGRVVDDGAGEKTGVPAHFTPLGTPARPMA